MALTLSEAPDLADIGAHEAGTGMKSEILTIEDEALIAMGLQPIVEDTGHLVTGIARTRTDDLRAAERRQPYPVLADIHPACASSGIDAVRDILGKIAAIPEVFIMAYRKGLLAGQRVEPTILIAKPFEEAHVRTAISQALFFQRETLVSP